MGRQLVFDSRGNERQLEAARLWHDHKTLQLLYGGSKNSGKSILFCSLLSVDALMYPGTQYFMARKKLNDLRKHTRRSMVEALNLMDVDSRYYKFNAQDNYFEFHNDSFIYFLEARDLPEDPDFYRFGSMNITRGVLEEAGELSYKAYTNLAATVGRCKNDKYNLYPKLGLSCNPAKNFLYHEFYEPWKNGKLPASKRFIQALPTDNKTMTEAYYRNLSENLRGSERDRLLLGMWEFERDDAELIDSYEDMRDAFSCEYIIPEFTGGALITDLARKGHDRYLLVHVTGTPQTGVAVRFLKDETYSDAQSIEKDLRLYEIAHRVKRRNIVSDADGLGQYLGDYMKGLTEFHARSTAVDSRRYKDIKSECGYMLAKLFNEGLIRIIPQSGAQQNRILKELPYLRSIPIDTDASRLEILKKPEIKKLLGHSPDYLDVLIMSMMPFIRKAAKGIIDSDC